MPCVSHDARFDGLLCTTTFVPGGARGVLLKSNTPNRYEYADNFVFALALRSRLSVRNAENISRSHSVIGKAGSSDDKPAMK